MVAGLLAAAGTVFAVETPVIEVTHGTDEQAQLPYWLWQQEGVSIRLVQRLPDQTRGFFLARGFSREGADRIANACVFQTVMRNEAQGADRPAMDYALKDWRVVPRPGQAASRTMHDPAPASLPISLPTQADWDAQWQALKETKAARIAFRWSTLPRRQSLQPGDYFWGMTVYGLAPGSHFDLHIRYTLGGKTVNGVINNLVCAKDE